MAARERRAAAALWWIGGTVAALLIFLIIGLAVVQADADALRGPISRMASARLQRPVELQSLELHLLTPRPQAIIGGLRIGGPPWARSADLVRIGQAQIWVSLPRLLTGRVVLPFVRMRDIDLQLVRNSAGQANWQHLGTPPKLPLVRTLDIGHGQLHVRDARREMRFDGPITVNAQAKGAAAAVRIEGHGDINGASFQLYAIGQPLMRAESHKPYTFDADVHAGLTHANAHVTVLKPFDLGVLALEVRISGDDFADLYYLTGLALPNSRPYTARASVERNGNLLKVREFAGTLGRSDVHGTGNIDINGGHPVVKADLKTRELDLADLGPALGGLGASTPRPGSLSRKPKQQPVVTIPPEKTAQAQRSKLLPESRLDLRRVRGMDADVTYYADSLKEKELAIRRINLQLTLHRGVLALKPLSFAVPPSGAIEGDVIVDASRDVPDTSIDLGINSVQLSQLHLGTGPPPLGGTLVGRLQLHGRGASVHEAASTATGTVTLVVPRGEVRQAFAELAGINVAKGLGLLLTGDQAKIVVQCGVANFKAENGVLSAQNIVFDTDTVVITGKGNVHLGDEVLDLSLAGHSKKPRMVRVRAPILIQGTLRKPEVEVQASSVLTQVGVAVALGVILTPIGSILAFVDPGLAKDPDCAAVMNKAAENGAPLRQAAGTAAMKKPAQR